MGPSPLLGVAAIVAFVFPERILRRPFAWSLVAAMIALAIFVLAIWAMTGTLLGFLGIPFAFVAPIAFWLFVKALRLEPPRALD